MLTKVSSIFRFVVCLLATATGAPTIADSPLDEVLAAAPDFDARFYNIVANDAALTGSISIRLIAPHLSPDADSVMVGAHAIEDEPTSDVQRATSVIANLATSTIGVMQNGSIDVSATRLSSDPPRGFRSAPSYDDGEAIPALSTQPLASFVLGNHGFNAGNIGASIDVGGRNQGLIVNDEATNAVGAMNSGSIRINIADN